MEATPLIGATFAHSLLTVQLVTPSQVLPVPLKKSKNIWQLLVRVERTYTSFYKAPILSATACID